MNHVHVNMLDARTSAWSLKHLYGKTNILKYKQASINQLSTYSAAYNSFFILVVLPEKFELRLESFLLPKIYIRI